MHRLTLEMLGQEMQYFRNGTCVHRTKASIELDMAGACISSAQEVSDRCENLETETRELVFAAGPARRMRKTPSVAPTSTSPKAALQPGDRTPKRSSRMAGQRIAQHIICLVVVQADHGQYRIVQFPESSLRNIEQ